MREHGVGRRAALIVLAACGGAAAQTAAPRNLDDWRRHLAALYAAVEPTGRNKLLAAGEAALAAGDAAAAQEAFQRAALMAHAADTECSIVRAHMQAGEYRRALAFGAHAALAHRDYPAGTALYAWLLHVGGQGPFAARTLEAALARAPDDIALRDARTQLAQAWPRATASLLAAPLRIAPYAHGKRAPSRAAHVAGSALLVDDGRAAVVPSAALGGANAVWLRNGLGATVAASAAMRIDSLGLTRLDLDTPLSGAVAIQAAAREPFAGSAGCSVGFASSAGSEAAWPLLHQGFFGRTNAAGERLLGIELPVGPRGGAVFDATGRLAGIALAPSVQGDADRLVPITDLQAALGIGWPLASGPSAAAPLDAVYELALHLSLQVIVESAA
jgi:tetratricopeptide (TPR) repeat protein